MIEGDRLYGKHGIHKNGKAAAWFSSDQGLVRRVAASKSIGRVECRRLDGMGMKFFYLYGERIAIDEVPGVALKLSLNIGDQSWGSIDPERRTPPESDPQECIKTNEMVHVSMGDKNVAGTQQTSRTQCVVMAEIEQEGSFRPTYFDEQPRIVKDVIDEMAGKGWIHRFNLRAEARETLTIA